LEADGADTLIRKTLLARTAKLWPGSPLLVPVITLTTPLQTAIRRARLQSRIRYGAEPILEKLVSEKTGIANVKSQSAAPYGERISRLLIFSNDGAERFYRRIEQTLTAHAPRILGCLLDADGDTLGKVITGKPGTIKTLLIEHKDAVSDILRVIISAETE
ncbi:MAG: hypothetical protein R6W75_10045, partial [Smithellaceae bacterium]